MTDSYGQRLGATAVRFERLLPGPVDRVWAYIVDGEKRARWLAAGAMEMKVDGIVELHFHNASLSPGDDNGPPPKYADLPDKMSYSGRITRCEPPRLLAHTWIDGDHSSEVEYVLEERDNGVLLTVTHRKIRDDMLLGVLAGWHAHLDIFGSCLAGRTADPFWPTHTALEQDYAGRIGDDD